MSHTFGTFERANGLEYSTLTIVNYVVGGEAINPAELLPSGTPPGVLGVIFGNVPPAKNSLGVLLFPVLDSGKVRLFQFVSGAPVEIATTNNLNAQIPAMIAIS